MLKNTKIKRSRLKNTLLSSMVVVFVLQAGTGVIKYRQLWQLINFPYDRLPIKEISVVHDVTGLLLIILITTHLFIQRGWFVYMWKRIADLAKIPRLHKKHLIPGLAAIAGVLSVILVFLMVRRSAVPQNIKELQSVEVRQYEGENLSSIADFRENSIKGPQNVDIEKYELEITGIVENEIGFDYDEVLDLPNYKKVVTLHCVEGWSAEILWEGVLIEDLMNKAEVEDSANTVIFHAYDGYTSSLSIDFIKENNILLAYKMNDVPLPPERGFPFQVVAEDKWGYKWVKWVTKIEITDDEDYRGYWERAGYSNDGDIDGPKFEK